MTTLFQLEGGTSDFNELIITGDLNSLKCQLHLEAKPPVAIAWLIKDFFI